MEEYARLAVEEFDRQIKLSFLKRIGIKPVIVYGHKYYNHKNERIFS